MAALRVAPPHLWVTAAELGSHLPVSHTHSPVLVHSISSLCYQSAEIQPEQCENFMYTSFLLEPTENTLYFIWSDNNSAANT